MREGSGGQLSAVSKAKGPARESGAFLRPCNVPGDRLGNGTIGSRQVDLPKSRRVAAPHFTNAGSIAALTLTTEALVAEIPEKKEAQMGGGSMEGMY